jgi:NAD(P)-dependent dehydrogenase (short-subunit alcohol dehydrogenase family)
MEERFREKVAIVTGAGQGIGKAAALRLAKEGARAVAADKNPETAERTALEIRALGRGALAYQIDVADVGEIQLMVDAAVAEFGQIDILVNAAGVVQTGLFWELTEQQWDRVVNTNLKGTMFCVQTVGRRMMRQVSEEASAADAVERSYGKMVNFSSIAGRRGRAAQAAYAASKAGIINITQSAASAFAPYGINVNAVCPGIIPTPMWEQIDRDRGRLSGLGPGEAMKSFVDRIPLKRAGTVDDVAGVVAFLCSPDAAYITGQTLNVDGGFEMH